MKIDIPELSLVVLIGASASGKTSFARRHFLPTEIVSSDYCRAVLADDENDQSVTTQAFELLHTIVGKRLQLGRIAVVDATNVQPEARKGLIALAKQYHVFAVALVFDLPEKLMIERHEQRTDRAFGAQVIRRQRADLSRSIRGLEREGFRFVHVLKSQEQVDAVQIARTRLWTNRRDERGPFDIIGDVHGCHAELLVLLETLGYAVAESDGGYLVTHPAGRRCVFVGDLVDRGPRTPDVVRLVQGAVQSGAGLCVAGNHDVKLSRALRGKDVKVSHGLEQSLAQYASESETSRADAAAFLDRLVSHYVLDDGRLVVAHAGLSEELQGRSSGRVRSFAMYGETTGETDEFGLPVRYNWANDYRGKAMVVYGHTPVATPEWLNNTICIDTGCVFGGRLTALRYPERELVQVPAAREYYAPVRPLVAESSSQRSAQQESDDLLAIEDVLGRRHVRTRLAGTVQVREENASAALEHMSRFAVDPRWLVYLPPTMSPSETSGVQGLLEHPEEALAYYRERGVAEVICEEKHMGSRAVVILCRDAAVARRRFGTSGARRGVIYTRTGRPFFTDESVEEAVLQRLADGMMRADLWGALETDWVCLDAEIMPWSAKAIELLKGQYASVAAAGDHALAVAEALLAQTAQAGRKADELLGEVAERRRSVLAYREAYQRYCWEVGSVTDLKLAPFHVLASEGKVHVDRDHLWHLQTLARMAEGAPELVVATAFRRVVLGEAKSEREAIAWWSALTTAGGEGMVVKPFSFIAQGRRGILQPAIKCRGPEYLRIIYGPEYLLPENLGRLRERGLSAKRSLAIKEFALGVEALERFVRRDPLRSVHECVFATLALESEPVDPRL